MFKLYSEIKYIFPSTAGDRGRAEPSADHAPQTVLRPGPGAGLRSSWFACSIQHGAGEPHTNAPQRAAWAARPGTPPGGADHNPDNPPTCDHNPADTCHPADTGPQPRWNVGLELNFHFVM